MLKGYPIGYIMLWEAPGDTDDKTAFIGTGEKAYKAPKELVIDGQQRLTALLSVFYGEKVKDKSYRERVIRIADGKIASNEINEHPLDPKDIQW